MSVFRLSAIFGIAGKYISIANGVTAEMAANKGKYLMGFLALFVTAGVGVGVFNLSLICEVKYQSGDITTKAQFVRE